MTKAHGDTAVERWLRAYPDQQADVQAHRQTNRQAGRLVGRHTSYVVGRDNEQQDRLQPP